MFQYNKLRKSFSVRSLTISILIFVIGATILISSGLPNLEFDAGQLLAFFMSGSASSLTSSSFFEFIIVNFFRILVLSAIIVIPILAIFLLSRAEGRKIILVILIFGILFITLLNNLPNFRSYTTGKSIQMEMPEGGGANLTETKGEILPPGWIIALFSLGISALIIGAFLYFFGRVKSSRKPMDRLADEARKSIQEIESGGDIKDIVIRCYFEMIEAVKEQHGLKRGRGTTTRELETKLESMGLPATHVRRLTRIFEKVRYGAKQINKEEEDEAVSCLRAIVEACEVTE
jgi:hypothetical protein